MRKLMKRKRRKTLGYNRNRFGHNSSGRIAAEETYPRRQYIVAANLGAHEVMEVHETLTTMIDGINTFQLLRSHVKDQQLGQMMDHQLQFAMSEYNNMVDMLHRQGMGQAAPYRAMRNAQQPVYGLDHPAQMSPNTSPNQLDDRDISSILLGCHKSSAAKKMLGALECANSDIRRALQQSAVNCSEQAYEVWQYMNQQGYYQVPTMKEVTTNTMTNMYQAAGSMQNVPTQPGQGMQGMTPNAMQGMTQNTMQHMGGQHGGYSGTLPQ